MKKRLSVATIILLLSFTLVNAFSVASIFAGYENPNTDWLYNADYGLDMHTIFEYKNNDDTDCVGAYLNDYANAMDVVAMAGQAKEVGAEWLEIHVGQKSGSYISPNTTYDNIVGTVKDRTATRDVPLALYEELNSRGLRMALYLNILMDVPSVKTAMGFTNSFTDTYIQNLASVWRDWSLRYGNKVSMWWIDGMWDARFKNSLNKEKWCGWLNNALKAGNPNVIIAFNHGKGNYTRHSSFEDYTAGECNDLDFVTSSRWIEGLQTFVFSFLGSYWLQPDTRFSDMTWINYIRSFNSGGGTVMIDVYTNKPGNKTPLDYLSHLPTGVIPPAHMTQLLAIRSELKDSNHAKWKTTTASSVCSSSYPASNVVDVDTATYWSSDSIETNPWWQTDLGAGYKLSRIELASIRNLDHEPSRRDFEIRASNDISFRTYTVLGSQGSTAFDMFGTWRKDLTDNNYHRFIRVQRTNNAGNFKFSEFRAYGVSGTTSSP